MTDPRKLTATRGVPGEERREMEMMADARRAPTMIPIAANPHQIEDAAAVRPRLLRPGQKTWVRVSIWLFLILPPCLFALGWVFSLVRGFFKI